MKIRKFAAPSVPQALRQVRDELGENAVILNTRQVPAEGGGQLTEVTAALDASPADAAPVATAVADPAPRGDLLGRTYGRSAPGSVSPDLEQTGAVPRWAQAESPGRERPTSRTDRPTNGRTADWLASLPKVPPGDRGREGVNVEHKAAARTVDSVRDARIPDIQASEATATPQQTVSESTGAPVLRRLRQIEDAVRHMARHTSSFELPPEVARLGERLRRVGVNEDLTRSLLPRILRQLDEADQDDREAVVDTAAKLLYTMLPKRADLRIGRKRKVVAFVGPSGSGKTTAMAKVAAGFVRRRRRRDDFRAGEIAIISTDTQRVGALAQARAYADLIGIPLEDAHDAIDLQAALARHAQARLVLIDTAGIGPHDLKQREHLRGLLEAAGVDEVQVVLDGRTGYDHMLDVLEICEGDQPRRLLLSKMDESMHPGAALSAAITGALPSSFFTTGPAIPGGISPGDLQRLVDWVVGRCPNPFAAAPETSAAHESGTD